MGKQYVLLVVKVITSEPEIEAVEKLNGNPNEHTMKDKVSCIRQLVLSDWHLCNFRASNCDNLFGIPVIKQYKCFGSHLFCR